MRKWRLFQILRYFSSFWDNLDSFFLGGGVNWRFVAASIESLWYRILFSKTPFLVFCGIAPLLSPPPPPQLEAGSGGEGDKMIVCWVQFHSWAFHWPLFPYSENYIPKNRVVVYGWILYRKIRWWSDLFKLAFSQHSEILAEGSKRKIHELLSVQASIVSEIVIHSIKLIWNRQLNM